LFFWVDELVSKYFKSVGKVFLNLVFSAPPPNFLGIWVDKQHVICLFVFQKTTKPSLGMQAGTMLNFFWPFFQFLFYIYIKYKLKKTSIELD